MDSLRTIHVYTVYQKQCKDNIENDYLVFYVVPFNIILYWLYIMPSAWTAANWCRFLMYNNGKCVFGDYQSTSQTCCLYNLLYCYRMNILCISVKWYTDDTLKTIITRSDLENNSNIYALSALLYSADDDLLNFFVLVIH